MVSYASYKERGFLLIKRFFDPEEVGAIREDAKEVFLSQMRRLGILSTPPRSEEEFEDGMFQLFAKDLATFTNCGKQAQHLISLHRLSLNERLIATLKDLGLEFPNISTRPLLYFNSARLAKKEVYWRLSLHQDWRSMQGSLDAVVVWLPLTRIDRSLGALEVIPGSHKWGLLDAKMADGYGRIENALTEAPVAIEVDVGDALFFSALLVHQSGTNVTSGIRWSCHFRYNNLREKTFIARGFPHPYIYKPQEELLTHGFPEAAQIEDVFG